MTEILSVIFCAVMIPGTICVIVSTLKSGQPLRQALSSAVQGLLSLIAVNVFGLLTGVSLSVNWYTLAFVSVFGMPATVALTVLKYIFR